jgi:hypothetical protein
MEKEIEERFEALENTRRRTNRELVKSIKCQKVMIDSLTQRIEKLEKDGRASNDAAPSS